MPHWIITALLPSTPSADDLEALGLDLVEHGALGAHVSGPHAICFFLEGSRESAMAWSKAFFTDSAVELSLAEVPDTNWVLRCAETIESLKCGSIEVHPVVSAESMPPQRAPNTLYLIPGLGFGTGHHATTKTALELLQLPEVASVVQSYPNARILDVGTGSGILAIGAVMTLDKDVLATDIDKAALANAHENASLNAVSKRIELSTSPLGDMDSQGPFSLIIANIYAEVLVAMGPDFYRLLTPGTLLLLSGIMSSRYAMICESFEQSRWQTRTCREVDGWVTLLMQRT